MVYSRQRSKNKNNGNNVEAVGSAQTIRITGQGSPLSFCASKKTGQEKRFMGMIATATIVSLTSKTVCRISNVM